VPAAAPAILESLGHVGRIPVRNIWLLYAFAADLVDFYGEYRGEAERAPTFTDHIARLLNLAVERRLRTSLSRNYQPRRAVLSRVRGRIAVLPTLCEGRLEKGQVVCAFEDFTLDTPRNRFVRAALERVAHLVADPGTAHTSRSLARGLAALGVGAHQGVPQSAPRERLGRNDRADRLMMSLSRLVFDVLIPSEAAGTSDSVTPGKQETIVRKLFERAVGNYYSSELSRAEGWVVRQSKRLVWPVDESSPGLASVLPSMVADIVIDNMSAATRLVIDTKFANIFAKSPHRDRILKSGYLYQIYSYVRTQEATKDPASLTAAGMLLHPSVGYDVDEAALIQGHRIRFATVDLTRSGDEILGRLRDLVLSPGVASP
jgi:5-methylcytosine-specific restriction enzyme subunit McrC